MEKEIYQIQDGQTITGVKFTGKKVSVIYEVEKKEFKRGDYVFRSDSSCTWVAIHGHINEGLSNRNSCYITFIPKNNDLMFGKNCRDADDITRLATPSEIQLLTDALTKENKVWNPTTLTVDEIKAVPKIGDCVKAVYESGNEYYGVVQEIIRKRHNLHARFSTLLNTICESGYFEDQETIEVITRSEFQAELSKLNYQYNFETNKIEVLKWEPKHCEECFLISTSNGSFEAAKTIYDINNPYKVKSYLAGRIKKTEAECQLKVNALNLVLQS